MNTSGWSDWIAVGHRSDVIPPSVKVTQNEDGSFSLSVVNPSTPTTLEEKEKE